MKKSFSKLAQSILAEIEDYKQRKTALDNSVSLSKEEVNEEHFSVENKATEADKGYMTLLSEGSVLCKDNTIRLFIQKGALSRWYNNLDDSFEGYVTTGHVNTDTYPIREGLFRKADMKLVTDENGRSDILVKPQINMQLSTIKDLITQDEPFAISSEFRWECKEEPNIEEYSKLVQYNIEQGGSAYVPFADTVDIKGFSFVANPGNAKSGGYSPELLVRNEEERLNKQELLNKVLEHLSKEAGEAVEEVVEEKEAPKEEVKAEEVEAPKEAKKEEVEDKTAEALEKATEAIEKLQARVEELEKDNAEKDAELSKFKANEQVVEEQFSKLEGLLGKIGGVSVEAPVIETKEKKNEAFAKTASGLRKRFGGRN